MSHAETRTAKPGTILSQWWTLGAILADRKTTGRHGKAAWVIVDRYMQKRGSSRASLRYIEKATGLDRKAVIKACRELAEWGYVTRVPGEGTRPSEYVPQWVTTPSGVQMTTTSSNAPSGVQMTTGVVVESTPLDAPSGVQMTTKSYLQSPADKPADSKVGNEDTPAAPTAPLTDGLMAADAGAARDPEETKAPEPFDRFWKAFPRKYQKPKARAAWDKLSPGEELAERIIDAAARWAEHYREHPVEKKWIPTPANWLAGERYDEDLPEVYVDAKEAAIAKAKDGPRKKDRPAKDEPTAANDDIPDFMIGSPRLWPAGRHTVEIVDSDVMSEGPDEAVIIHFRVVGGPHDGEEHKHRFWTQAFISKYQEEGQKYLAALCEAAGVKEIEDTTELHGYMITATAIGDRIEYAEIEVAA